MLAPLQNFFPLRYNESITLVKFRIVHTVAFVTEVLYELDTVNVKIDYNMTKCAEANYIYVYIQETLICSWCVAPSFWEPKYAKQFSIFAYNWQSHRKWNKINRRQQKNEKGTEAHMFALTHLVLLDIAETKTEVIKAISVWSRYSFCV